MRYLTTKLRPRKKRLIRQPSAATFSRWRRHICTSAPHPVGGGTPDDPQRTLLPSGISTFALHHAFSCRRRGTAERWMRSNALPYSKTSTEEKTPHPSAFGCHLLPPEKAYLYLCSPPCRGRRKGNPSPPFLPASAIDQDAQATKKGCPCLSARATAFSYCLFPKSLFGSSQNSDASRRKSDGIRRATPTYKRSISGRKRSVARVEGAPFS